MGIRGLSSFITQNKDILKPFELYNSTVIFDGKNLSRSLYHKYELDFIYGGEYERYYDCIKTFISNFLKCDIKCIVVIDGGQENSDRKLKSSIERAEKELERAQSISRGQHCSDSFYPLLAYEVFYSALFDLGIQVANSDYSADDQVAALGNYYKCPVISNDSDFYIFDIPHGVIHLDSIDPKINFKVGLDGKEYKFLNCNIYHIDEFVKAFPGLNKSILPLFGTLIGNEFVEPKTFDTFFSNIQLPEYRNKRISFNLRQKKGKKMVGLLCWLQHKTPDEAVKEIISYFEKNKQEYIMSIIDNSVSGYKINPCSLIFILEQNINDPQNDLLSNTKLITPCGNPLPQNFILKFHHGQLPSFFINAIVLHTVFLRANVENMEMKSSHLCSFYMRQILYGILVRHDVNGAECKNKKCLGFIEEYDRKQSSLEKRQVQPLISVACIGLLPNINDVHLTTKKRCITILAKVLGIDSDYFLHIPDEWQLFIASINYWLRISDFRSEAFVSAIALNLIYFGLIKCKNPVLYQNQCRKVTHKSNKCNCSSITCIAAKVSESDLKYAEKKLDEYCNCPTLKPDRHLFLNVAHSFSQIQSCLLYITYLNQLLNDCLKNPAPHKCFSGIMLYNLTQAMTISPFPKDFISTVLEGDLNLLFTHLKSKVCENVPNFTASI